MILSFVSVSLVFSAVPNAILFSTTEYTEDTEQSQIAEVEFRSLNILVRGSCV